jgi:hypothetical protein
VKSRLKRLLVVLGIVVVVVGAVHCWFYLGHWRWPASPKALARRALSGATVEQRTAAAVRLADCGVRAREELRQVFRESDTPEVRAACIHGLGAIEDYDSMDMLLDELGSESLIVRGAAGVAVSRMVMGHDLERPFRANDPEEDRAKAIEALRQYWEELRGSPLLKRYLKVRKEMRGF